MKLFCIQSPYYWSNLYVVSEKLGIETYEILVDNPTWPTKEYDNISKAKKIRLWNEKRYGSGATPHNRRTVSLGEGGDMSWLIDDIEAAQGIYTNKIGNVLNFGDDVVLDVTTDSFKMIEFFQSIQEEYSLRLHYMVWRDFPNRANDNTLVLQYLPFLETAALVVICNSHDLCQPFVLSFRLNGNKLDYLSNEIKSNWEKETLECNLLFLDIANEYLNIIKQRFEGNLTEAGELLLYEFESGQIRTININEIDFRDHTISGCLYESITPGLNHDNCKKLKEYRKSFAKKYSVKTRSKLQVSICM